MKTVFISAFNPFILRNILLTGTLRLLAEGHHQAVVFVPDYKKDFFQKEISSENIIIEGVPVQRSTRQDVIFRFINSSLSNTRTLAVHKKNQLAEGGRRLRFLAAWALMKIFSRLRWLHPVSRQLDYWTMDKRRFSRWFDLYRPDLVFTADVFHDDDAHLLAEAKSRRIQTVGMVRSWDNFTTKGVFRVKPDQLIVHNEIIKGEAVRYGNMQEEKIFVSGIPQYDRYINGTRMPRAEFFRKLNFHPERKLILFSPLGKRFSDTDWQIMEILKESLEKKLIPPAQVLIRFTPNDEVPLGQFVPNQYFYLDKPGRRFQENVARDQELTEEDMNWLADCLYHSDVIIAGGASIGIDGAIFGKPSIVIHFDGLERRPYLQSARRFFDYNHVRAIIKSGAMRSAQSRDDLLCYLNNYLRDPELDSRQRAAMLAEQCWKLDGRSGERIAKFLVDRLA